MAHVFISYSSRHRELTEKLAALLSKEGYSVWWDYELESWDSYQSQIDAALAGAAVVVVIWSEGAAKSIYVKAEANKALAANKLINVCSPDFPFSAVPSPYNAMHVDRLDFVEPYRLMRSIRGVWNGKPHVTAKPLFELHRETFGVDLFDPKREPRSVEPGDLAPSDLLQARREAVPFIDALGLVDELLSWCQDGSRATAGRLIHGAGGLGKTRLMIETARRLRSKDWIAGFLSPPWRPDDIQEMRQCDQALEQVFTLGDDPGVLMVVDYAEGRKKELETLARILSARPANSMRPVRLILLARGDQWWKNFYEQTEGVEKIFRAPGMPVGDTRPLSAIPAGQARLDFFVSSVAAFEPIMKVTAESSAFPGWDGTPPSQERLIRLMYEPTYARPLAIQMEALLYLELAPHF